MQPILTEQAPPVGVSSELLLDALNDCSSLLLTLDTLTLLGELDDDGELELELPDDDDGLLEPELLELELLPPLS